jgi:hypothetical protein
MPANRDRVEETMIRVANELRIARSDVPRWATSLQDLVTDGRISRSEATLGSEKIVYHASYGPVPEHGVSASRPYVSPNVWDGGYRSVLWVDPAVFGGTFTCVHNGRGEIEWITVDEFGKRRAQYDAEMFRALDSLGDDF